MVNLKVRGAGAGPTLKKKKKKKKSKRTHSLVVGPSFVLSPSFSFCLALSSARYFDIRLLNHTEIIQKLCRS
mgnify:CR=1 FL=1